MTAVQSLFFDPGSTAERWLPIEGWPGYEVSDWGHVRTFWGAGSGRKGRRAITSQPKLIGYALDSGHRGVLLYRDGSTERRRTTIHTLVLEAFVGPRPEGMWGLHRDGNPANNRADNLYWGTPTQNNQDCLSHGNSNLATLTDADIPLIWPRILAGEPDTAIGRDFNVSGATIGAIRSGNSWVHVARYLPGWPIRTAAQKAKGNPVFVPDHLARTDEELWRPLPEWPPYRVSNRGRVQSCLEKAKGKGVGRNVMLLTDNWTDRATYGDKDGYQIFSAYHAGKYRMLKIHACVLLAFAGPAPAGFVGCHNDGNRANNHAWNLRWDTSRRNVADRQRHAREGT